YPSRHEGLGSVLIDALEAGLPVVATAVGGIPEIVEHGRNGLLVDGDDPEALERAVLAFRQDPSLRARVATANRDRARLYSSGAMADRYESLYRELSQRLQDGLDTP